jgi:hypothetical protein
MGSKLLLYTNAPKASPNLHMKIAFFKSFLYYLHMKLQTHRQGRVSQHLRSDSRRSYDSNSSGVYICTSVVNYLRYGDSICKSEGNYRREVDTGIHPNNSSGVYICNLIVNYLRHGNFICKS